MRKIVARTFGLLVACLVFAGAARAQTEFEVTPAAGPYLVCVTSFTGDMAKELTEGFIQELRTKHRLSAYSYCHSAAERRKEQERIDQIKERQRQWLAQSGLPADTKLRGPRTYRIEDQYAVLVGGYKDMDDAAHAAQQLRKLDPPDEKFMHQAAQGVAGVEAAPQVVSINPFRTAFPVRNPSIQAAAQARDDKPDERLKEYNAGEPYSLLKNAKPWTLAIKSYQGATSVQQVFAAQPVVQKAMSGFKAGELLNANAKQAHELAAMLRKLPEKYDAYVLHTEYSSVVTIGGFEGPDDPRLAQVQRLIMAQLANPNSNLGQLQYRAQVGFFTQPMPMAVPRP